MANTLYKQTNKGKNNTANKTVNVNDTGTKFSAAAECRSQSNYFMRRRHSVTPMRIEENFGCAGLQKLM